MKKMNRIYYIIFFLVFFVTTTKTEAKILSMGSENAQVIVKVFSSLTCPHCANFHKEIFNNLKKDFINKGLVKFEHHAFPLDLAALNAEIIVRCHVDNDKKFQLLDRMYEKQKLWAVGSDINNINNSIKKIGLELNLNNEKMDECLNSNNMQDDILSQRIEAQKKYKIDSTPTIFINEKKYDGKDNYNQFKKVLEKKL